VTAVVLDEADRMFEMGFEYQMRSLVDQVGPIDWDRVFFCSAATPPFFVHPELRTEIVMISTFFVLRPE
jgi:superfamily II DNA/RNA helicase